MDLVSMFILAVVQGMTEFLPISSSAHVFLFGTLLGDVGHHPGIDIMLHGATLLAVIFYFRKDILRLVLAFFSRHVSDERSLARSLLLGTIPIFLVGFFVYPLFSSLRSVSTIAIAFFISGLLLIAVDYAVQRKWVRVDAPLWRKGLGIGLMQVFALLPGVSRSGITITAGRLFGFSRKEAARFSFFLAIPAIIGALVLLFSITPLTVTSYIGVHLGVLMFGMLVTFITACLTIHFFLKLIERIGFLPFFGYQVVFGVVLLLVG